MSNNNKNNNNKQPQVKSEALLDEDGFQIVVKGKKNKVLKVNQKIEQTITTNDNKKNKEIRDKYFEKQNQWTSNYQESEKELQNNPQNNNNNNNNKKKKKNNKLIVEELSEEQQLIKLYNSLIESENKMKETKFFKDILELQFNYKFNNNNKESDTKDIFSKVNEIVCYGIGDFSSSKKCLDQLAYITSIKSMYSNIESIYIYDPVMNNLEKQLISKIGFKLIEINEEGKRKANTTNNDENFTIFYMPFCGRKLYDNVLWANWETLSNIIIIGNSFNLYIDSINRVEEDHLPFSYTTKTFGIHDELLFPNNYTTQFIFHDLAIHLFPQSLLQTKEPSFYSKENNLEPPKLVFGPE
ncbi:hypothetical protein DDB_G0274921 [Dictyostelium discoideum AX4]|uniref:SRR1-like domain-containing protein n=1 Tax=Dictyostelium discoideum TaxID=44689 RepID=Q555C0_DICDI|nr:hypothetical protein DDB_G0274921 [Dictyostelium discoideum AX4]EAL70353.1 hypothetical protein DDB_G0274921 [Dictyostelium discoideum AX4]|eukprot:XP_644153.1 hypothetical protein DDB_G0274921 [Dictyostelium discoideum AX4]